MKMWIVRDCEGLAVFSEMPTKYYANPNDKEDFWWISNTGKSISLDPSLYPEVTFENSPMEVELKLIEK